MHNTTKADYKVLKENPIAQMVIYHTDKLPVIYHTRDCTPLMVNLQVTRGDKGFGEATNFFQAQLTDDLLDIEVLCSGACAHELWQTPVKPGDEEHYLVKSTVSVTTGFPDAILLAPQKKRPAILPEPVMGTIKEGTKVCHFPQSTGSTVTMTKLLFKDTENSSTDSDDVLFCESPELDNDQNDDFVPRMNVTHKIVKYHEIRDTEEVCRVTHSISKQTQRLHNDLQKVKCIEKF